MNDSVSLTIDKSIVNPIVEAKVKEALIAAMGGEKQLIEMAIDKVFNMRCNENGVVSNYSSDNKYTFLDAIVIKKINEAINKELIMAIDEASSGIREALLAKIKSKKGSSLIAEAMIDGLKKTFDNNWSSKISIAITPNK